MAGTPILVEQVPVEKKPRQPSKALSVKDKNKMCSILGFLMYLKETGKLDEEETKKMMEELPIYGTARLQTEFFEQDMFDLKKVELELWKPMVLNNKNEKKQQKEIIKKQKETKKNHNNIVVGTGTGTGTGEEGAGEKKKRQKKVKKEEEDEIEIEEDKKDTKKRGRKAKKQIIQFNDDDVAPVVKEDQLEELLNDILEKEDTNHNADADADKIDENNLEDVLKEMELELELELEEDKIIDIPVTVTTGGAKKKKNTKIVNISEEAKKDDGPMKKKKINKK